MTVITDTEARRIAERIFGRPIADQELRALKAAESAGRKIEGYVGYVVACHVVAAWERES